MSARLLCGQPQAHTELVRARVQPMRLRSIVEIIAGDKLTKIDVAGIYF
jgi:hypothetical protein